MKTKKLAYNHLRAVKNMLTYNGLSKSEATQFLKDHNNDVRYAFWKACIINFASKYLSEAYDLAFTNDNKDAEDYFMYLYDDAAKRNEIKTYAKTHKIGFWKAWNTAFFKI